MIRRLIWIAIVLNGSLAQAQFIDPSNVSERLDTLSKSVSGLNELVDFTLVNAPLHDLLRAVAETHNLNVSFKEVPDASVTNNFTNVLVKDLLIFICQEYDLRIRFTNNIFSFYPVEKAKPKPPTIEYNIITERVSLDLRRDPILDVIREITRLSKVNIIIDKTIHENSLTAYIKDVPIASALSILAESNNLKLRKIDSTVFRIEPSEVLIDPENSNTNQAQSSRRTRRSTQSINGDFSVTRALKNDKVVVSVLSDQSDVKEIIKKVCEEFQIDYLFISEPEGTLTCRLIDVGFEDFLDVALESANFDFSLTDGNIFIFGEREKEGLDEAHVYSFKRRSVEGIEEIIPESIRAGVSVAQFNDLNAFIVTGSDKKTEKLISFFKEIDKSVPNVLIEVIVVEISKGSSIQTGIKGVLSDSVPNTGGEVFPGIDLTLSSASLNKFLNNLDSKGVVNLGRVTPNFYVTLQAMEANNNLNIRSTPKLSTINGHEANLTIGQSVYYLIETQNVTGGVNPIVTVTPRYEKVEANLEIIIRPFVSDYQDITLDIEAEFSDFIAPTVQGAPPGNSTRKFISKIRVKNEETIVIGGLEESSKTESGSGVPILSRIPGLKWLFSSKTKANSQTKLLIFIKPTIVY